MRSERIQYYQTNTASAEKKLQIPRFQIEKSIQNSIHIRKKTPQS